MKKVNLENLSIEELVSSEKKTRKALLDLRFEKATGKLINTGVLSQKRKELARILTSLSLKANQAG